MGPKDDRPIAISFWKFQSLGRIFYGLRNLVRIKMEKSNSVIPADVLAASQDRAVRSASSRDYYFLKQGGGVTLGDSPRGRFVYGFDGFTLWCQSDGYIYASDGLHQLFSATKEGEEPSIAFFLDLGGTIISLLPVPFLGDGAQRYTVSTIHATYYFTEWKDVTATVRVTTSPTNQLLFSLFVSFQKPRENCRLLTYCSPYEKDELGKSDEDRWFLTTKTTNRINRDSQSRLLFPPCSVTVFEDPDRFTSLTHQSLLRGSCTLAPGIKFQEYEITTSRKEFIGGNNRNLNNPVSFERRHFPEQRPETVFNDKGIFSNALFFEVGSDSELRLDYMYQRVLDPKDGKKLAGEPVTPVLVDRAVQSVADENSSHLHALEIEGLFDSGYSEINGQDFFPFLITLQHQVAVCSKIKGYMQLARRSLVGIRDVFQALEAYLYFAPDKAREKILEALGYTCLSGRCLRQYLPGSPIADTREFIDQGLWVIKTIVEYVKVTGDQSILSEAVGYHEIVEDNPFIGAVRPIETHETVLQHLFRILEYLIKNINPKTQLLMALYGDWNDALDGLGYTDKKDREFGTGTTVMGSLQLYQNCHDMIELLQFLDLQESPKDETALYQDAKDKLYAGLVNNAVVGSDSATRVAHGFGDEASYTVGGPEDPDGASRYGLTSNAYWIISGIHRDAKTKKGRDLLPSILSAYEKLDDKYGLKTFHPAFARGTEHWFGRIPRLPVGTAENGATYNHATLFGVWSLFQAGQSAAAWKQLEKLLPFTAIHNNYNLTPFVIPNSYIHNMEKGLDGESMNDWQTGSSNVLLKILIWYVFGFRPELSHLRIQPDPQSPLTQFSYSGTYQNKKIVMSYEKTSAVKERTISLNEKSLDLFRDEELNALVADLPGDKLGKENQIKISDPLSTDD
jgi:cellobiose phosphorylase